MRNYPISKYIYYQFKNILLLHSLEKIADEKILRLGVKGGGCSGLSYILEFEEKTAFDDELTLNGVPVIIDKRQMMYLVGMELDYRYGLNNRGFIFNNPNAKTTCGCGTSFSA